MALSIYDIKNILRPAESTNPSDDFRVLDSWADYEDNEAKSTSERNLEYLCYEIKVIDPESGEEEHLYKALKFARVIRLPKAAKQSTALADMHSQILTAVYESHINLVTIIANVIEPALGLLYLYGVQATGRTIQDAKDKADRAYIGFTRSMQGTYKVLEMRTINAQESEWLREKMYGMEFMTAIRGIPKYRDAAADMGLKGIGGRSVDPEAQGTLEEIITGLADYEYVLEILSTPVRKNVLKAWLVHSERDLSDWYGQMQGTKSLSANLSIPMMYMANLGQSQGWSNAYTDANSVSYNHGSNYSTGYGESVGASLSETLSSSFGHTQGLSRTDTVSQTQSISQGQSFGLSTGGSFGNGVSSSYNIGSSQNIGLNNGISVGQGQNISHSEGFGVSNGQTVSNGESYSVNQGQNSSVSHSVGTSQGTNWSNSFSQGTSYGTSTTDSTNHSIGSSQGSSGSVGLSNGWNSSNGGSNSINAGWNSGSSQSTGGGTNHTDTNSFNGGVNVLGIINGGGSHSWSDGTNTNYSNTTSNGISGGASVGSSWSTGESMGINTSGGWNSSSSESYGSSHSVGYNTSNSTTQGFSQGGSYGTNESFSTSIGQSMGESWGVNRSVSNSLSLSQNSSDSWGESINMSRNAGQSQGWGISQGASNGTSTNYSSSMSASRTDSLSSSYGVSTGRSIGESISDSYTQGISKGTSSNWSSSQNVSEGSSYGEGTSSSTSTSNGVTGGMTTGTSSSMGFGPSIGYSKSYQWLDKEVQDLIECLDYQNERLKKALRGQGAFYTYVYLAVPNMDVLEAAKAVAKSTWQNDYALTNPLQILDLTEIEQKHLLYHFTAFSADVTREWVGGAQEFKNSTVLLPMEYVAYTHLPRISEGGIYSEVNDIPHFAVPSMMRGEIYMGTVISAERYTMNNGYNTQFEFRIPEKGLMHGFFTGASRSGKTVAAMRFIAELSHIKRSSTGKRLRIVCMDPKRDWRTVARFVEPERFNFYSLGDKLFHPIHLNPCKVPHGVDAQRWIDGIIDIYCRAYGLLERGKQILGETLYALYDEAGVFKAMNEPDWMDRVPELSKQVTFPKAYAKMERIKEGHEDPSNIKGRIGNDTRDAYARLLDRLQAFSRPYSVEHILFGSSDGVSIDEVIGDDCVTVFESEGLESSFNNFIFGCLASGIYKYAKSNEGGFLAEGQYETVMVIEEANKVFTGSDVAGTGSGRNFGMTGQSEFEEMLDQSAGYGLYIFCITQKISSMPSSVLANSGLKFIGRLAVEQDVTVVINAIGRDYKFDDRELVKWFPRSPTGWFVVMSSRGFDIKDAEPVLVKVSPLNMSSPSNAEIDEILTNKAIISNLAS